jgi:hypothetical protein
VGDAAASWLREILKLPVAGTAGPPEIMR